MPSRALLEFESNLLVEVDRLLESRAQLNHGGGAVSLYVGCLESC
jgi:hypothetical protein